MLRGEEVSGVCARRCSFPEARSDVGRRDEREKPPQGRWELRGGKLSPIWTTPFSLPRLCSAPSPGRICFSGTPPVSIRSFPFPPFILPAPGLCHLGAVHTSWKVDAWQRNLGIFCSCFQKISTALTKADTFLLENTASTQNTFTLAIAAYALSLGDKSHPRFRSIVSALKKAASVKGMTLRTFIQQAFTEHIESVNSGKGVVACKVE